MTHHKRETTCRKSGGPVSKGCSCEHCSLDVCSVCGGGEGSLTTDCPGTRIDADRHQELCETRLDYTDARGWHLAALTSRRSPSFDSPGWKGSSTAERAVDDLPAHADPRALIAPSVNWSTVDRVTDLQRELASKAIAWAVADRICEEHSAVLTRIKDEIDAQLAAGNAPADLGGLIAEQERARIDFRLAEQQAQEHDDEFRQTARRLVATIEEGADKGLQKLLNVTKIIAAKLKDNPQA